MRAVAENGDELDVKFTDMKRLINYIRNLFGADVRLRKWCAEVTKDWVNADVSDNLKPAQSLYNWVTRGELPE